MVLGLFCCAISGASVAVMKIAAICRLFLGRFMSHILVIRGRWTTVGEGPVRSEHRMLGYRLFYLDRKSHIIGRDEFMADDDSVALQTAASLHKSSDRAHSGLMLWQGARQVFASDEASASLFVVSLPTSKQA